MKTRNLTRRRFLESLAAGAGVVVPTIVPASAIGADGEAAASERIAVGIIGCGSRGMQVMSGFAHGRHSCVLAVCDVQDKRCRLARKLIQRKENVPDCTVHRDFREVLDRRDIDAIAIFTPNHWHAFQAISACRAGKDVFCEKPLSHSIREGRLMVAAARRYGRIFSGGSQRVRSDHGQAADYVASGHVGKVEDVYVGVGGPPRRYDLPGQPVPSGVDWDLWVGPAPWRPFNEACVTSSRWHQYEAFGGGGCGDWGSHRFGGALYAMQLDETGPVEVAMVLEDRGKSEVLFRFANGLRMHQTNRYGEGLTYLGTRGRVSDKERKSLPPQPASPLRQYRTGPRSHPHNEFLHCVRTRERPFRDVEYAHRAATMCHLSNIARKLSRPLRWDPDGEHFLDDEQANRLLSRAYRSPWRL